MVWNDPARGIIVPEVQSLVDWTKKRRLFHG
jgi:hypothetical protein